MDEIGLAEAMTVLNKFCADKRSRGERFQAMFGCEAFSEGILVLAHFVGKVNQVDVAAPGMIETVLYSMMIGAFVAELRRGSITGGTDGKAGPQEKVTAETPQNSSPATTSHDG